MPPEIRKAVYADVPAITGIYNEAILTTTATFDTEPKTTTSQRKWFKATVLKILFWLRWQRTRLSVGHLSVSTPTRCAYADTAELSLYVKESFRNQRHWQEIDASRS